MIGLGTIVNVGTVLIGTTIGILLKNGLPKRFEKTVMQGLGLKHLLYRYRRNTQRSIDHTRMANGTQHTMLIIPVWRSALSSVKR